MKQSNFKFTDSIPSFSYAYALRRVSCVLRIRLKKTSHVDCFETLIEISISGNTE